jgi:hypothetical protein
MGRVGDAGKFSANMLEAIWAYAHFTEDWGLVKERWQLIKSFTTRGNALLDSVAMIAEQRQAALSGFARLAYQAGVYSYNYACYSFAPWCTCSLQRSADYFRRQQLAQHGVHG